MLKWARSAAVNAPAHDTFDDAARNTHWAVCEWALENGVDVKGSAAAGIAISVHAIGCVCVCNRV